MDGFIPLPQLSVNTTAIVENWQRFVALAPNSEVASVVKSDSYGLGAVRISQALFQAGCRTFFTATVPEAIELLTALPDESCLSIASLSGFHLAARPDYQCYPQLLPILNTPQQIQQWRKNTALHHREAYIHVDTGMNRLGLRFEEWSAMHPDINFPVRAVMSHLANADEADSEFAEQQRERLFAIQNFPLSLANSAGSFLGEHFHGDLLRPGVALYGGNPIPHRTDIALSQCLTLEARILQIRTVAADESIGYGQSYRCHRESRIATVGIGYNDGLPRVLGNHPNFCGWWGQYALPIRGRISMDSLALDITDIPNITPDARVSFLNQSQTLDDLAKACNTIPHEVLTNFGGRIRRVHSRN